MSPSQAGVCIASGILICASTIAVGLRFRARMVKQVAFKSDDYLAAFSVLFVWALGIILIVGAARGTLGTHTQLNPKTGAVIPTWHEIETSKFAGISQLLIVVALGALKLSVLMLYRRIFVGKTFNTISIILCITIVAWTVSFFFATLFECGRDFGLLWQSLKTFRQDCGKYKYIQLGHAASDVATDLMVLALPLPVIWKLHMTKDRKIGLSFIFMLGSLSTAAGTARLVIVAKDIYETTTGSRDVRGVETNAMVWSYVEVGVGVVAACLPTLRPILGSRTPESLINSVRSVATLDSLSSSARRHATASQESSAELKDYESLTRDRSNPEAYSRISEQA